MPSTLFAPMAYRTAAQAGERCQKRDSIVRSMHLPFLAHIRLRNLILRYALRHECGTNAKPLHYRSSGVSQFTSFVVPTGIMRMPQAASSNTRDEHVRGCRTSFTWCTRIWLRHVATIPGLTLKKRLVDLMVRVHKVSFRLGGPS